MPHLAKKTLSQFIRTACKRQLRLNLSPDTRAFEAERTAAQMPPKQPPRPGLEQFAQAGEAWQSEKKYTDLVETFGERSVVGEVRRNAAGVYTFGRRADLRAALAAATPHQFIVEPVYHVTAALQRAMGIDGYGQEFQLTYGDLLPDLLQILPARTREKVVTPDGKLVRVASDDERLQVRVIDIKLTAEASPSYFGEVVYYATVLAGWLIDEGLGDRFAVADDCAVWAGSHDASHVTRHFREAADAGVVASAQGLFAALNNDLEFVPFEVFSLRLRRFLQNDLPDVLRADWRELPWHVDNRCRGCDYLGMPWVNARRERTDDPQHCIPMAEREDHLSRVAFISRGTAIALRAHQIGGVAALAQLGPGDNAFDIHQALRATRTVVAGRARALQTDEATIPAEAGSSSVMPRWADLRLQVTVDFDISSAITLAIGIQGFWRDPGGQHATNVWRPRIFVVDQRNPEAERRELLAFLRELNAILENARQRNPDTTFQLYLWDSLQFDHFTRIIGRHLEAILQDQTVRDLVWLFPPEEVLPSPALSAVHSPITVVKDAVRALLAAPIPHYYSLLATARRYHDETLPANLATFSIHPLFEDSLSDQIPSERAHEIWTHSTRPHWTEQIAVLRETVEKRLRALQTVTRRLETDLRGMLSATAPRIAVRPPVRQPRLSTDGQLWYTFAKLDEALQDVKVHRFRAMPAHEREAKFESARLQVRLHGREEQQALELFGLNAAPGRRVYRLRPESIDVKRKVHDFNVALVPEDQPLILDKTLASVVFRTPLQDAFNDAFRPMEKILGVRITGLDRERRLICVDFSNPRDLGTIGTLEQNGLLQLEHDVILDPTHTDFFTRKLSKCLTSIGNPVISRERPNVRLALGQAGNARRAATTPVAEALWSAEQMANTAVDRDLTGIRQALIAADMALNDSQWRAWETALTRRFRLLWGPPVQGRRVRCGTSPSAPFSVRNEAIGPFAFSCVRLPTRRWITLLLPVHAARQAVMGHTNVPVQRLRSSYRPIDPNVPADMDVGIARGAVELRDLRNRLLAAQESVVVGATPEQVQNLATFDDNDAVQPMFDLILIDEGTQMDVAHAILPLCTIAPHGSVVVAGDWKQLPPIHQAEPPIGLEAMLGPAYLFFREVHHVGEDMLEENYRSAEEIVEFCREAGYPAEFRSWSPDLQAQFATQVPGDHPPGWPEQLVFSPDLRRLLDPAQRCVCIVYDDGRSSQSNRFEADLVGAVAWLLFGRMSSQLSNERDAISGRIQEGIGQPYTADHFWQQALGVVTPHRAQQALVTARLQELFRGRSNADLIRDAIDTVERFQGQQRDVIVVSFALGDPDQIAEEDEFLHSLNRFNVMASRARAKLIVLVSQQVVDHLASDIEVLRESRLLKSFVETFCNVSSVARFGWRQDGVDHPVDALVRVHTAR